MCPGGRETSRLSEDVDTTGPAAEFDDVAGHLVLDAVRSGAHASCVEGELAGTLGAEGHIWEAVAPSGLSRSAIPAR